MQSPSSLQETFFNLKTLTLQRGRTDSPLAATPAESRDDVSIPDNTRQSILQASLPSQRPLKRLFWRLKSQWKILAVTSVVAFMLILIIVLFTLNRARIYENRAEVQGIGATPSIKYLPVKEDTSGSSIRNLLLTLASQQSQINSLRADLKDSSEKMKRMEASLTANINTKDTLFQSLVHEANITFCTQKGPLVAPVKGVYRVEFSANVHGDTYISRKMFQIKKNDKILQTGGTIRIKYNGRENKTVDCAADMTSRKSCFAMAEILLVQLDVGDTLKVIDEFTASRGGSVYGLKLCMRVSDYTKVPGGRESLVITH